MQQFSMAKYFDNIHSTMTAEEAIFAAARFQSFNGKPMAEVQRLAGQKYQAIPEPLLDPQNYIEVRKNESV